MKTSFRNSSEIGASDFHRSNWFINSEWQLTLFPLEVEQFVTTERNPIVLLPTGYMPSRYCHIIVAEWNEGKVEARVQFFLGPDYDPPTHRIQIAKEIPSLKRPGRKGHQFVYFAGGSKGGYSGEASELKISCLEERAVYRRREQ